MAATLDRTRVFGTVSGDQEGRAYEQDNLFFTADGALWVAPEPAPDGTTAAPAARKARPAAQPVPDDPQIDPQPDQQAGAA